LQAITGVVRWCPVRTVFRVCGSLVGGEVAWNVFLAFLLVRGFLRLFHVVPCSKVFVLEHDWNKWFLPLYLLEHLEHVPRHFVY
ncbi:hypothetical protein ACL1KS_12245, partial [Corynebacterium striatum]